MHKLYRWLGLVLTGLSLIFVSNYSTALVSEKNLEIYTIQPWYTFNQGPIESFEPPAGITDRAELLPSVANELKNKFPANLNYSLISQDEDILTSKIVEKLAQNQLVLWQGHGDWNEETETVILDTGRDFDFEEYAKENSDYHKAVDAGEIVQIDYFYEGITPKYVDKYTPNDLSGSLIFFAVCHSGHNDSLAKILLNRGASTVVASTLTLQMDYGNLMQYETVRLLGKINPSTNNYHTINEALESAKKKYGPTDPGSGGELIIFGDENYRIMDVNSNQPDVPLAPKTGEQR